MSRRYSIERSQIEAISDKAEVLTGWLAEHAPHCEALQKHLDPGTMEQAYWHYGYVCALRDILALVESDSAE